MKCHYCGYYDGGHNTKAPCPEVSNNREADMVVWRQGYDDGRAGLPKANDDPRYSLGYLRGEVALEEAENGSPWVTYT